MFAILKRWLRKRKLAFVASAVPAALKGRYGGHPSYTAGQVRRTVEDLRVRREIAAHAFAACCNKEEFNKALPERAPGDYERLRSELVDTFEISTSTFTCDHLRSLKDVPRSNRWAIIGDGQQGTYGGGVQYNETMIGRD
jgi:hypothetical protein